MLLAAVFFFLFIAVLYLLLRPIVNGAMYFPAPANVVKEIISVAGAGSGQKIADLGSGDGRIVIALARTGANATGYEINPLLVFLSRHNIAKARLSAVLSAEASAKEEALAKADVHWKSFWREDLSSFDTIVIYGYPKIMDALEEKFSREIKPGAKIISLVYPLPNRTPAESRKVDGYVIRLYIKE